MHHKLSLIKSCINSHFDTWVQSMRAKVDWELILLKMGPIFTSIPLFSKKWPFFPKTPKPGKKPQAWKQPLKSFIDVFYHQIRNGIQGYTTRAPPFSRGGRVWTGDQTISSPMSWPLGHDIPKPYTPTSGILTPCHYLIYHAYRCIYMF